MNSMKNTKLLYTSIIILSSFITACGSAQGSSWLEGFEEYTPPAYAPAVPLLKAEFKDYEIKRLDRVRFYKTNFEYLQEHCDIPYKVSACTSSVSATVRTEDSVSVTEGCNIIVHEMMHQVLFDTRHQGHEMEHHSPEFYEVISKVCYKIKTDWM